jgi:hypothetical protein
MPDTGCQRSKFLVWMIWDDSSLCGPVQTDNSFHTMTRCLSGIHSTLVVNTSSAFLALEQASCSKLVATWMPRRFVCTSSKTQLLQHTLTLEIQDKTNPNPLEGDEVEDSTNIPCRVHAWFVYGESSMFDRRIVKRGSI